MAAVAPPSERHEGNRRSEQEVGRAAGAIVRQGQQHDRAKRRPAGEVSHWGREGRQAKQTATFGRRLAGGIIGRRLLVRGPITMHMDLAHSVSVIGRLANPVMVMCEAMGRVSGIAERQGRGWGKQAQRV
jgi:hypothetical protein